MNLGKRIVGLALAMAAGAWLVGAAGKNRAESIPAPEPAPFRAGLRSSPYGARAGFPAPPYWLGAARSMASRFERAVPTLVWIVGTMEKADPANDEKKYSGRVLLSFPAPAGKKNAAVVFSKQDANESYLEQFDRNGFQVWLQVEPGDADVGLLIELVLRRYGAHPCVIGFGIDVEWHRWRLSRPAGAAVSDAQAEDWLAKVRSSRPEYRLFLKHWLQSRMPPRYRHPGLVFINNGQRFASLAQMGRDFEKWGRAFFPSTVGFQFGYPADRAWWQRLNDPAKEIGSALLSRIPNVSDLIWVDFTMKEIWSPAAAAGER
jgi:hypothetical protein